MNVKSIELAWIVVKDLKQAVKFYTEVVGLKLAVMSEEFGWAELTGHEGGSRLGIAQVQKEQPIKAGQNAVVTFTVDNLEKAKQDVEKKGGKCVGKIEEIPGHVKLQLVVDSDGNHFQLVEMLG